MSVQPVPLWRIGVPESVSRASEFGGEWPPGDEPALRYRVGVSSPERDWPLFHPSPLNASTGWRQHRMEVAFDVAEGQVPGDGCVLRLRFAGSHGPCPDLAVDLDGAHRGLFHPHVVRDDRAEVDRQGPIAGECALDIHLPAAWLAPGAHVLTLTTTVDRAAATGLEGAALDALDNELPRHREQYGNWFGAGITWRGLGLWPAAAPAAQSADVALAPTPLYLQRATGLDALIDLTVRVPAGAPWPPTADVHVAGRAHRLELGRAGRDFGDVRVRFPVPEFDGDTEATVLLAEHGGEPVAFTLHPARKWTLHLIPHVHLDVGYTDAQGKVLELHSRNLDRAIAALERDDGFRFSLDGSLILDEYLATRAPGRAERVLAALRERRLAVNAFHSLFLSGVASLEETYRAAYAAVRLRDEYGVPVEYANLTDVPSYSSALPAVLTSLGITAFVGIENHSRGANADSDAQHLATPVRWQGVDGSTVLTHFADAYSQLRFMVADPQTVTGGAQSLPRYVARYERPDYAPHDLALIGTHADNEDLADGDAGFAARWNAVYAHPRLRMSTLADYLDAVRPLADRLPLWRGDGGSYWEDGVGTGAAVVAEHRAAQSALPAAEGLAALVARADPGYRPNREALDRGWEGALYGCEHTWTWSHSVGHPHGDQVGDQLDWKRHRVHTAHRTAIDEARRALSQLGELVSTDGPTLLVHNPLGWARAVTVEAEVPAGTPIGDPALPYEVLEDCDGLHRVRLTVPDVPGFGYRALPLGAAHRVNPNGDEGDPTADAARPAAPAAPAAAFAPPQWRPVPGQLTTARWEMDLDPATGAVVGLVHRATGRRLLDPVSPYRLGQVLHVINGPDALTRGDRPAHTGVPHRHARAPRSSLLTRRPSSAPPELTVATAALTPVGLARTHDGWRLRAVGTGPSLPFVQTDLLLRDDDDRVELTVRLEKERVLAKESVYVPFPFLAAAADGSGPRVRYDRQQGWVDPATDHAPGACNEWFTTHHGVAVDDIAWCSADAPLFTVGDVVRGTWAETFEAANGTVLSWVMNNYWPTNTPPEQEGSLTLRYAFTPLGAFDPAAASRFGLETRAAPMVSEVTRLDKHDIEPRQLPADSGTLLDLGLPGDCHATVAEPRDRRGLLLRVQNLTPEPRTLGLRHTGDAAVLCRADEHELHELPLNDQRFTLDLTAWQVVTVKLR
ncbi:polysaccharide lyase family protein [Streptomyces sp. PT12]|uniref:glycoside hydrolase family 38 N-terminal domain-containing protein n=1 Tax=Streptomyces sp. PT12 TaxID=1510197 RepID=UPI0015EF91D3|nr:polysaccharide lyase family protein [Streptomyces sp. PT12]